MQSAGVIHSIRSFLCVSRITGPAWVSSQAAQIRQRELEARDREYEERLAEARKAEARLRALANARVMKRQVWRSTTELTSSDAEG